MIRGGPNEKNGLNDQFVRRRVRGGSLQNILGQFGGRGSGSGGSFQKASLVLDTVVACTIPRETLAAENPGRLWDDGGRRRHHQMRRQRMKGIHHHDMVVVVWMYMWWMMMM